MSMGAAEWGKLVKPTGAWGGRGWDGEATAGQRPKPKERVICTRLDHGVFRYLAKQVCWVGLWGYFWVRLIFESADWVKPITLPSPLGAWTEQEGRRKICSLCLNAWAGTLVFCPWTGNDIISHPGSQAFRPQLNLTTSFSGWPVCGQQIEISQPL